MGVRSLLCVVWLLAAAMPAASQPYARAVFQVKSFIKGPVEKGEYGDSVSIKWSPGHDPELVLYDAANNEVKREALQSYSHEQLEAKLEGYGFKKTSYERDEFFDPEPKPKSSSVFGGLDLYLPQLISTSGMSERVKSGANTVNGEGTMLHSAGMPAGRRMGQGFMRGDEA